MSFFNSIIFFDKQIQSSIVYLRNDFLNSFFWHFTNIGHWLIISLLVIFFSGIFYLYKRKKLILPLLISVLGSGIMTVIIKYLVDRTRPVADLALYVEKLPSFPSAHAALSSALFGFLIYCFWRLKLNLILKIILSLFCLLIILLVGFSRLYLGVHFFSDVLAGYLVGLLWCLIAIYFNYKSFK
jgi:undecaprenyl-diphosphatase